MTENTGYFLRLRGMDKEIVKSLQYLEVNGSVAALCIYKELVTVRSRTTGRQFYVPEANLVHYDEIEGKDALAFLEDNLRIWEEMHPKITVPPT